MTNKLNENSLAGQLIGKMTSPLILSEEPRGSCQRAGTFVGNIA